MGEEVIAQEMARLRQRVARFVRARAGENRPVARVICATQKRGWRAFLFGGVLRDLMVYGSSACPRDVDIVVEGASTDDLASAFEPFIARRTRFGGLHLRINGWMFDIWPLAETWALRERLVPLLGGSALPRSTFLNVEAAATEIGTSPGRARTFYTHGFFEGILSRTVDINLEENPFPALCIVRSLITAARLGFAIAPRLAAYIELHSRFVSLEELLAVQFAHYGRIRASREEVEAWLNAVREQRRCSPASPVELPLSRPLQMALWSDPLAGR
jgi:hypothetical protein